MSAQPTPERRGDWIQTFTGRRFYPFDPRPEDIDIHDIAHALALTCRFTGHVRRFYSVAEHSVRVSLACKPQHGLWGLLHDASEAYLCDVARPVKRDPRMEFYRMAEVRVHLAIADRFGLPSPECCPCVREADETLLATEARDLMGHGCMERWALRAQPQPFSVEPWSSDVAEGIFLSRFEDLGGRS